MPAPIPVIVQKLQSSTFLVWGPAAFVWGTQAGNIFVDLGQWGFGPVGDGFGCHINISVSISQDNHVHEEMSQARAASDAAVENLAEDFSKHHPVPKAPACVDMRERAALKGTAEPTRSQAGVVGIGIMSLRLSRVARPLNAHRPGGVKRVHCFSRYNPTCRPLALGRVDLTEPTLKMAPAQRRRATSTP